MSQLPHTPEFPNFGTTATNTFFLLKVPNPQTRKLFILASVFGSFRKCPHIVHPIRLSHKCDKILLFLARLIWAGAIFSLRQVLERSIEKRK